MAGYGWVCYSVSYLVCYLTVCKKIKKIPTATVHIHNEAGTVAASLVYSPSGRCPAV